MLLSREYVYEVVRVDTYRDPLTQFCETWYEEPGELVVLGFGGVGEVASRVLV